MSVYIRVALTIGAITALLAGWTALVLQGWLPAGAWEYAAIGVAAFNVSSVSALLLAQRSGKHVPFGLLLVRLMAVVFVWELLLDVTGSILGVAGKVWQMAAGNLDFASCAPVLIAGTALVGIYSVFVEPRLLDKNHLKIKVPGMSRDLSGFTIAQLSDVHLGAFVSVSDFGRFLSEAVKEQPDALVVTGDLFDSPEQAVNDEAALLLDSFAGRFPAGIWFVWGNHEYYRNAEAIAASLSGSSVHVLRNSCALVREGTPPLYFAGVDYPVTQGVAHIRSPRFVAEACQEVPKEATLVMLAHHPDFFDEAAKAGAVLTLSGHTHGGQMGLFGHALMPPVFRYVRGLYEKDGRYCYVHKGSGGRFPYRLGCMPEIAFFTLVGEDS